MVRFLGYIVCLGVLFLVSVASAQTGANIRTVSISAGLANITTQLRMTARAVAVYNKGPNVVWINLSRNALASASYGTNIDVRPNTMFIWRASAGESVNKIGAITASSTATVLVYSAASPEGLDFLQDFEACNMPATSTDITVDNTVGGVEVVAADVNNCNALVVNNGGNDIRCAMKNMAPTATSGIEVVATASFSVDMRDGIGLGMNCIRTGASNSTVSVFVGKRE